MGVGLTHTANMMIKKLKSARETGELETEGENALKRPLFGEFSNLTLIYQTTIQTISSSRTPVSYSRNVRAL